MEANKRTKEQINQEYGNTCAQIGERVFQISVMEQDIELLNKRITDLGEEAKRLDSKQKPKEQGDTGESKVA